MSVPIQPDVNNDNNTTRLMETDTVYSSIITDGIATIENGYISDLNEPSTDNQIATKYYVDNSGSGGGGSSGPNGSVQYNDGGNFAGSPNLTLSDPGLPSATLNINGTLTNGVMTMSGSQINGLTSPTNAQEAATKEYVDQSVNEMSSITITLQQNIGVIYTPAQIYNKIANLQFVPNNILYQCPLDRFPSASAMKTFLGSEFVVGKTWMTTFRSPQVDDYLFIRFIGGLASDGIVFSPITYIYCALGLPVMALANYSVSTIVSVVTNATSGSEQYYSYCVSNVGDLTLSSQITAKGVLTPSFGSGALLSTGSIIYPIPASPSINSSSSVVYTYANLRQFFIIRTGLTADTDDTFVTASVFVTDDNFSMGGGTFRFFIQNPNAFNLTLLPSAGWSFSGSNIIPANHCGAFWITVTISPSSCLIRTVGINPING